MQPLSPLMSQVVAQGARPMQPLPQPPVLADAREPLAKLPAEPLRPADGSNGLKVVPILMSISVSLASLSLI